MKVPFTLSTVVKNLKFLHANGGLKFRLFVTLTTVVLFTLFIIYGYDGQSEYYRLYYFVPVSVPIVFFIFDRLSRRDQLTIKEYLIDFTIAFVSLVRIYYPIPFYSGHALFLTYALFTSKSKACLIATVLVLAQTAYIKLFLWAPDYSLSGGIILGFLASVFYRQIPKQASYQTQ